MVDGAEFVTSITSTKENESDVEYFICESSNGAGRLFLAVTDNEYIMRQFIKKSVNALTHMMELHQLVKLSNVVCSKEDEETTIRDIEEEYGISSIDEHWIFSMASANNEDMLIYMTTEIYDNCCNTGEVAFNGDDTFSCMFRSSYNALKSFNILKKCIVNVPQKVSRAVSLVHEKYFGLIGALIYSDMHSWENNRLKEAVLSTTNQPYLDIYDVVDETMAFCLYFGWEDDHLEEDVDEEDII